MKIKYSTFEIKLIFVNECTVGEMSKTDYNLGLVWSMVFNATFNNISVISWWSVLLVEETGVLGENH